MISLLPLKVQVKNKTDPNSRVDTRVVEMLTDACMHEQTHAWKMASLYRAMLETGLAVKALKSKLKQGKKICKLTLEERILGICY